MASRCDPFNPGGPLRVISGCAGPSAARRVKLKKRTPKLDRADLKLRNLLAGWQQYSACWGDGFGPAARRTTHRRSCGLGWV